jgi:hypothetical protein
MAHTEATTTFVFVQTFVPLIPFILTLRHHRGADTEIKTPPAKVHGGLATVSPAPGTAPLRDTLACDHGGIRPRLLARALSAGSSGAIFGSPRAPVLNLRPALCSAERVPTPPLHRLSR